jgi:MFS family permease
MGLAFSFVAGPVADRLGRKGVMVVSLIANGAGYLLLSQASTLSTFAILMGLSGAANPLYRVGADAMLADLISPEKRPEAYSLLRMSNNVGVALGPLAGGLIAVSSYGLAFYLASAGMIAYGLLVLFLARETLQREAPSQVGPEVQLSPPSRNLLGGYGLVLGDRPFVSFTAAFTLAYTSAAMMWVLLSVYTKENFSIPESRYGLIPMTNALMVVVLQFPVTQAFRRLPPLWTMALGSLFYAFGVGSVAVGQGFWAFWTSMVVMTIGELILVPTGATYAANLAPAGLRGRYMSIYGLTWGVAVGVGPVLGGLLNDHLGPQYIWWGAGLIGLLGAVVFSLLARGARRGSSGSRAGWSPAETGELH